MVELFDIFARAEDKADEPDTGEGDDGVNDTCQKRVLTTADPSDDVEGK